MPSIAHKRPDASNRGWGNPSIDARVASTVAPLSVLAAATHTALGAPLSP
jgi:hypothetical protein